MAPCGMSSQLASLQHVSDSDRDWLWPANALGPPGTAPSKHLTLHHEEGHVRAYLCTALSPKLWCTGASHGAQRWLHYCRVAAEIAVKKGGEAGPASLRTHLIDTLYTFTEAEMESYNVSICITEPEQ